MKQFIYVDSDIVNSIIAQKERGLIKETKFESSREEKNEESDGISGNIESGISGGFLKFASAEAKFKVDANLNEGSSLSSMQRDIIEKTMHDAAFDIAYDYIKPNKLIMSEGDHDDYGEYVELVRTFDFVDLEYLDGLFEKNGLMDFVKKTKAEEIRKDTAEGMSGLNREQTRAFSGKIKNEIEKIVKESNKEFDDMGDVISAFKKMIPYNRMLISSDGYLIPMDEKYFRVNPSSIGFMYGGEITCVGMITNIIGKDTNIEDNTNIFANLQFSVNEVLRTVLPTKENNICIIHPIGIYYDKQG